MKHIDRSMIFLKFQFGISSMKIPFGIDSAGRRRTDEKKSKERRRNDRILHREKAEVLLNS